jgi:hypothetical protein
MTDEIIEKNIQSTPHCIKADIERYESRQQALYLWAQQVHHAIHHSTIEPEFWGAVGHGLVVLSPDPDELEIFLKSAADTLGAQYLNITLDSFLERADQLTSRSSPCIVYIEPGDWSEAMRSDRELRETRARVAAVLNDFHDKGVPTVVVTHAEQLKDMAGQLRRSRAFDRFILWESPGPEVIAQDLYMAVGDRYLEASVLESPERLGKILALDFPNVGSRSLLAAALRRRAILERRKAGWRDLIEITAIGVGEGYSGGREHGNPERVATHEAGHAIVMLAGSAFGNIPDLVSIVKSSKANGVALNSYQYRYESQLRNQTFADACQAIRISLAGRAAEELEYGLGRCSLFGAEQDLSNASRVATSLVVDQGFPLNYENPGAAGSNLYFPEPEEDFVWSTDQIRYLKSFMEKMYNEAKGLIQENRILFYAIRADLLKKRMLFREDLEQILESNGMLIKERGNS